MFFYISERKARLQLFDQNTVNSNIGKYLYYLNSFSISIYFNDGKAEFFSKHYSSLQCHTILQKAL